MSASENYDKREIIVLTINSTKIERSLLASLFTIFLINRRVCAVKVSAG